MTLHNAKGLKFDVVFIVALEKDVFPNPRAVREQMHNEEERRLFYVALTRARKRVYLSNAFARRLYGRTQPGYPPIFLAEIPRKLRKRLEQCELGPLRSETPRSRREETSSGEEPPTPKNKSPRAGEPPLGEEDLQSQEEDLLF